MFYSYFGAIIYVKINFEHEKIEERMNTPLLFGYGLYNCSAAHRSRALQYPNISVDNVPRIHIDGEFRDSSLTPIKLFSAGTFDDPLSLVVTLRH